MKDWTGNANSIYKTLSASSHCDDEREQNDYYASPQIAVEKLLEVEKFSRYVWEPAVGGGHIADVLKRNGHRVKCSDIIDRNYPNTEIIDFLTFNNEGEPGRNFRDIVTNPPYKFATEFVEHALDISMESTKIAMLLKIQFLETRSRAELFKKYPPKKVWIFADRINCAKNGDFSEIMTDSGKFKSAVCYAWYVWEKGYVGPTTLGWLFLD